MRNLFIFFCFFLYSCGSYKKLSHDSHLVIEEFDSREALILGKFSLKEDFVEKLTVPISDKNYILYSEYLGRIYFFFDADSSIKYFTNTTNAYNKLDEQGVLNKKNLISNFLAMTVSDDNTLIYTGSDYERVFSHFYNAINYLYLKDLNGALVEVRAANNIHKLAQSKRESKLIVANTKSAEIEYSSDVQSMLQASQKIKNEAKEKFLNSYVYYISGFIREINKNYNDALVDYKASFSSMSSKNTYLISDILRLSELFDYDNYSKLKSQYPNIIYLSQEKYKKINSLIIIYEQGFVPEKDQLSAFIAINGYFSKVAFPVYSKKQEKLKNVKISINNDNNQQINLSELLNVYTLAKNNLLENYSSIIARQTSRLITKTAVQYSYNENSKSTVSAIASFGGAALSLLETADTRSFDLLPSYVQFGKINSVNSINQVSVMVENKILNIDLQNVVIDNNSVGLLYLIDTGVNIYYSLVYKGKK